MKYNKRLKVEIELMRSELTKLNKLGSGSVSKGISLLITKSELKGSNLITKGDKIQCVKSFIEKYVEKSNNSDWMAAKELYDDYCEFCKSTDINKIIGKQYFNRILSSQGIAIRRGGKNILTIYGIKSNWL